MYKYDKLKLITIYVRLRWRELWYEHTRKSILTMENDVREDIYIHIYIVRLMINLVGIEMDMILVTGEIVIWEETLLDQ